MRAVEQDKVLSTGLGVCSEAPFRETALTQINVFDQQPQITACSLQKQGYTTMVEECRAQTGGRTEKKQLAGSCMQSHAVNEGLHQNLDFFFSSTPVFQVGLDASFVLFKHLCLLLKEATNLYFVKGMKGNPRETKATKPCSPNITQYLEALFFPYYKDAYSQN